MYTCVPPHTPCGSVCLCPAHLEIHGKTHLESSMVRILVPGRAGSGHLPEEPALQGTKGQSAERPQELLIEEGISYRAHRAL